MYDDIPNYDEDAVKPMRDELTRVGFEELRNEEAVDSFLAGSGTSMVVVNSVCGCAAGGARPGVALALQNAKIPDRLGTVFAGQDKRAVARFRAKLTQFAPSSPFIAVLKDGQPVKVMQRHDIEGKDPATIAAELTKAFEAHCARPGPSIPRAEYEKLNPVKACGSSIPRNTIQIEGMGGPQHGDPQAGGGKRAWWQIGKK